MDDNFLSYKGWKDMLGELQNTNKYFSFRQGLDLRLMTKEKSELFSKSKSWGDWIFAFDNYKDKELIQNKLSIWKEFNQKTTKLYLFCAFDYNNIYNEEFWIKDIEELFERIFILKDYKCLPYVMRYKTWSEAPEIFRGMYIDISRWCNQPAFFKKFTLEEFLVIQGEASSAFKYMVNFKQKYPQFAKYFSR